MQNATTASAEKVRTHRRRRLIASPHEHPRPPRGTLPRYPKLLDEALDDAEESTLIDLAQRGDSDAFGMLFVAHRAGVARVIARHVATHDIDEVTQEVAIRAFLSLGQLRKTTLFRSWLARIAHNACIDWIRRQVALRRSAPLEEEVEVEPVIEQRDDDYEDALPEVISAIARLKPPHATALLLRGLEGFSYRRIANELGVSLPSVKTYLHRARRTLKDALDSNAVGTCLRSQLCRFSRFSITRKESS